MREAFRAVPAILSKRSGGHYRERGWWNRVPLWERVRNAAEATPDRLAVVDETDRWSYGELWSNGLAVASALKSAGVEKGDAILVQLPNWREFTAMAVGAELAGAVFGFCPIAWGNRETLRGLSLVKPKLWITAGSYRETDRTGLIAEGLAVGTVSAVVAVRPGPRSESDKALPWDEFLTSASADPDELVRSGGRAGDPLEIAVTSGTTGHPKGVVHVHDTATAAVDSTIERQGIGIDDVVLLALPVGHTFGYFYGVRCALQAGAVLVMLERWDVQRMLDTCASFKATVSLGPTAFLVDLVAAPPEQHQKLATLKLFTQSGDPLPRPVAERAVETLPFRISRALGMTEFGHVTSTDTDSTRQQIVDSAGSAQPEIELRIVDEEGEAVATGVEGRIMVRGPFVCAGYLTMDDVVRDVVDDNEFFDTGDLGYLDESGYIHISGRLKNVIRRGAITIPVADLENVLAEHSSVRHVVIIGRPDARLGEVAVACVQLHDDASLSMDDVRALFADKGITKDFWPSDIIVVEEWPRGATDKIDRKRLLEMAEEQASEATASG